MAVDNETPIISHHSLKKRIFGHYITKTVWIEIQLLYNIILKRLIHWLSSVDPNDAKVRSGHAAIYYTTSILEYSYIFFDFFKSNFLNFDCKW